MKVKFAIAAILGTLSLQAHALSITGLTTNNPSVLVNALLGPGINVVPGSIIYQGDFTGAGQGGTYTGFNLTADSKPTLTLPNGIVLTTGFTNFSTTSNTTNETSRTNSGGSNAALNTLSGFETNNANALTFSFTVDPGVNAVSVRFVYASEEFPTQQVTDIFGFFVDGVNYARFSDGSLVRNDQVNPNNTTNFQSGYNIEFNGVSSILTAVGLLNTSLTTHTVTFAIADTTDTRFDSAVFLAGFSAGTSSSNTGGIGAAITTPGGSGGTGSGSGGGSGTGGGSGAGSSSGSVPVPSSIALLGLGLLALTRRFSYKS